MLNKVFLLIKLEGTNLVNCLLRPISGSDLSPQQSRQSLLVKPDWRMFTILETRRGRGAGGGTGGRRDEGRRDGRQKGRTDGRKEGRGKHPESEEDANHEEHRKPEKERKKIKEGKEVIPFSVITEDQRGNRNCVNAVFVLF